MKRLYFAYGANLNVESMAYRCPKARLVGRAVAWGKKRVFRGVADVVRGSPKDCVYGAVWEITPECEASLDRFEGFPRLYTKKKIRVWSHEQGREVLAMIYVMTSPKRPHYPPCESYYNTIKTGIFDVGWSKKQVVRLDMEAGKPVKERIGWI